jgi:flagellin
VPLDAGLSDRTYTVGGYIEYSSDDAFSVTYGGVTCISVGNPPSLSSSFVIGGLDNIGSLSGATVTLESGINDRTCTVGGYINFISQDAFTVDKAGSVHSSTENVEVVINELTVSNIDISTREGASDAIEIVDNGIRMVDSERAELGAIQNRFESIISNLQNISENLAAARSRILDADIAKETSEMTKQNILQQAGTSILSQANQQPQLALSLLQNL